MPIDLDTFLVALYTIVDDLYQQQAAPAKPVRRGPRPTVSDSEVLPLALCAQWWGRSERAFVRYARAQWRTYFPRFLSQSAYNRRCRDLAGVLVALVPAVARELCAARAAYQVLDTVAVPLLRRCRGCRRRLFGDEAALGWGGSDKDWYYGCKLLLAVLPRGGVTGFVLAPASTEDRWLADALLGWRVAPMPGPASGRTCSGHRGPTGPRMWSPPGRGGRSWEPGSPARVPIWPIRASRGRGGKRIGSRTMEHPCSRPRRRGVQRGQDIAGIFRTDTPPQARGATRHRSFSTSSTGHAPAGAGCNECSRQTPT